MKNTFYFSLDIIKSGSEGKGFYIEGYAATKDLDRQGDVILIDALKEAATGLLEFGNTVFFNHDYDRCVGRLDDAKADNHGLWVKIYISQWEEELRKKIEEGIISKFSIGGKLKAGERISPIEAMKRFPWLKTKPTEPVNVISAMELFEVSVVGLPANAKAEFSTKSLALAIHDAVQEEGIFKVENLGQIPDKVQDDSLPKTVAKESDTKKDMECDMENQEQISKEEVPLDTASKTPEEIVPVTEPIKEEINPNPAPVEKQEAAPEQAAAPTTVVETVKETTEIKTTQTMQEGKVDVTQEVNTSAVKETVINDQIKVTETAQTSTVRTYTEEELKAIRDEYQKQLDEKDAMINSLKAEVDGLKIEKAKIDVAPLKDQLDQITKDLGALQAKVKEVVVEAPQKSTPLAVGNTEVPVKETKEIVTPEKGFLKVLRGKR